MWAVLVDAVENYWSHRHGRTRSIRRRTWAHDRAWLVSNDRSHTFSFASICDALGLEAGYVRRLVMRANPFASRPTRKPSG
jgi:hypothetical protein